MQRSLSVLLPVRDDQSTLNDSVAEILDLGTDSGQRFEVLIIDDGSSDATNEVAHELTRLFPQVRLVRHDMPRGQEAAIRTGLKHSRGEVVMLRDGCLGSFRIIERSPQSSGHLSSRPAPPNFLRRLKNFALGE